MTSTDSGVRKGTLHMNEIYSSSVAESTTQDPADNYIQSLTKYLGLMNSNSKLVIWHFKISNKIWLRHSCSPQDELNSSSSNLTYRTCRAERMYRELWGMLLPEECEQTHNSNTSSWKIFKTWKHTLMNDKRKQRMQRFNKFVFCLV